MNNIRDSIFNLMKAHGYVMKMFDMDGGGPLVTPEKADYIYANKGTQNYMFVIEDDDNTKYNKVNLYRSDTENTEEFRDILGKLKTIAIRNSYSTAIKNMGRDFTPKDFETFPAARKDREQIGEAFAVSGAKKTSYHKRDSARVTVKHKKEVDEAMKNSRSRNISDVFVSHKGEKRRVSETSLVVGKAIANHIDNGGNLFDKTTNLLIELGNDLKNLKSIDLSENITVLDEDKTNKIDDTAGKGRTFITKFLGSLSRRKSPVEESVVDLLTGPEYDFTKAYFECLVSDQSLAESLARASIISSKL